MVGGAADRSGLIHVNIFFSPLTFFQLFSYSFKVGDEVIEVNGINVEGKTPADVLTILVKG